MNAPQFQHPSLTSFEDLVQKLLRSISNADSLAPPAQIVSIHSLLAQTYAAALQLPSTSVLFDDSDDDPESEDGAEAEPTAGSSGDSGARVERPSPAVVDLDNLAELLGLRRYYREVFDPFAEPSNDEVIGDLLDDLQDIHGDLSIGLAHWQAGRSGDALRHWRVHFQCHWGEHATSALRALFALSAWHEFPWPAA